MGIKLLELNPVQYQFLQKNKRGKKFFRSSFHVVDKRSVALYNDLVT